MIVGKDAEAVARPPRRRRVKEPVISEEVVTEAKRTTPEEKPVYPRKGVKEFYDTLGVKPYFYDEADLATFQDILLDSGFEEGRLLYEKETLHTLVPPMHLPPVTSCGSPADSVGFIRSTLSAFVLRAHIKSVASCQLMDNTYCGGGQLGYLANPAWSAVLFYQNSESTPEYTTTGHGTSRIPGVACSRLGIPAPVLCGNIAVGWNADGDPSLLWGIKSGNSNTRADRFVRYVRLGLKMRLYVYSIYNTPFVLSDTKSTFYTAPVSAQFCMPTDKRILRSPDFPQALMFEGSSGPIIQDVCKCLEVDTSHYLTKAEIKTLPGLTSNKQLFDTQGLVPSKLVPATAWSVCRKV